MGKQLLSKIKPGETMELTISYDTYLELKHDPSTKIIKDNLKDRLLELANDESLEELMKTDFVKFKNKICYYTNLDRIVDVNKISDLNFDAIGMVLNALQYHISEGGLKIITYKLVPPMFKFNVIVMKK